LSKVKLHGTNAAIQIKKDGSIIAQSRARILSSLDDNCGFATWVEKNSEELKKACPETIYFGEWCGNGIMNNVSISKISQKIFAVFAAIHLPVSDESSVIVQPETLSQLLPPISNVHIIPWYGKMFSIPMLGEPEVLQPILDDINNYVNEVENCDPFVKELFQIEGLGEGLVFYPTSHCNRKSFSDLCFKAKGEKHKIISKAKPAQLEPEVAANIEQFALLVLTEARLEQAARAVANNDLIFDKKLIGLFLSWVCKDIEKETKAELAVSKLTWKQVQNVLSQKARNWYINHANKR
jgi:hypothetical protein